MKNKALTYLLTAIAVLVWGGILYQIIKGLGGGKDIIPENTALRQRSTDFNDYALPQDTAHLSLKYPDPFRPVETRPETDIKGDSALSRTPKKAIPPRQDINWGFLTYSGFIKSQQSRSIIALLTIRGNQHQLGEGEMADGVKLIKNEKDSIKVSYEGKTKFIKMHNPYP